MNFYTVLTTFFQFLINLIKNITILIVVTCYLLKAINMILEEKDKLTSTLKNKKTKHKISSHKKKTTINKLR